MQKWNEREREREREGKIGREIEEKKKDVFYILLLVSMYQNSKTSGLYIEKIGLERENINGIKKERERERERRENTKFV